MAMVSMVTIVFLLPRAMPGDPLAILIDPEVSIVLDPADRQRVEAYYGLDRSLGAQYLDYLWGVVRADLGWSISRKAPVTDVIRGHLPWTLALVLPALVLSSLAAFVAGVMAAWRRGRWADRSLTVANGVLRSVPDYALAYALLIVGAVMMGWFPLGGAKTPFSHDRPWLQQAVDVVWHGALPMLAVTLALLGGKFLIARGSMVSVLGQDYVVTARAKGLAPRRVKYRHGARNATPPYLAQLGVQAGFAVGGSVFIERVFAYPGMGTLILDAVDARDFPLLEGCFLVLGALVLVANLIADVVAARMDPRQVMS